MNRQESVTLSEGQRRRLFIASCIALVATAMTFAIRGNILEPIGNQFALNKEQLGLAAGMWAYGFTISIIVGGPLCDFLGMGRLLGAAFVAHLAGVTLTIFTNGFWTFFFGTFAVGLGNGLIEATINPLVATAYSDRKTEKLNQLHVWFPGGIVIGGLIAFAMTNVNLGWQAKMVVIYVPILIYGLLFLGQKFPPTERVQQGISTAGMFRGILKPLFFIIVFCMILTASTELATNQWIDYILKDAAGIEGILVLAWINGLMAIGRYFAGPIVHRLSPIGLLMGSSIMSAIGLFALSMADSRVTAFAAATIFAIGICYFWPTMLGITSERFPAGGALALAIVGGVGTLSVAIFTWLVGRFFEQAGPRLALRYMVILPAILVAIFGAIYLYDKARGGYRAVDLAADRQHGD